MRFLLWPIALGWAIGSGAFYIRYHADKHWKVWMPVSLFGLAFLITFWTWGAVA